MDTQKLSEDIAALERKAQSTTNPKLKEALQKKIERLKNDLAGEVVSTTQLATKLLRAKKKIKGLSKTEFQELIRRLAKKPEYSFLSSYTKVEIEDDLSRKAKPAGWRFKGKGDYRVPGPRQLAQGKKNGTVYWENRPKHSDVSQVAQLKSGGNVDKSEKEAIEGFVYSNYENSSKSELKDKIKNLTEGDLVKFIHSPKASVDSKVLKVNGNRVKIEILADYTPFKKRMTDKDDWFRTKTYADPSTIKDAVKRGETKLVNSEKLEIFDEKRMSYYPEDQIFQSKEFNDAFKEYLKNKMTKGGGVGDFSEYSNDALTEAIINLSRYENTEEEIKTLKEELEKRKNKNLTNLEETENETKITWQDATEGDSALVIAENKMGLIIKAYGRKFHLKFVDGKEKTYNSDELEFFRFDENYAKGGVLSESDISEKFEEFKREEEAGTNRLIELKAKGITYSVKNLQPYQKGMLKDAEKRILTAQKNRDKLIYNHDEIKRVMKDLGYKQSTNRTTAIKGFSYPSKGYTFSDYEQNRVTFHKISLDELNKICNELENRGFVIDDISEPSKTFVGSVSDIFLKPFYNPEMFMNGGHISGHHYAEGGNLNWNPKYKVGDEVTFNYRERYDETKVLTGIISEVLTKGNYSISTGFSSILVEESDIISKVEKKEQKKKFLFFKHGGEITIENLGPGVYENFPSIAERKNKTYYHLIWDDGEVKDLVFDSLSKAEEVYDDILKNKQLICATLSKDTFSEYGHLFKHNTFKMYPKFEKGGNIGNYGMISDIGLKWDDTEIISSDISKFLNAVKVEGGQNIFNEVIKSINAGIDKTI